MSEENQESSQSGLLGRVGQELAKSLGQFVLGVIILVAGFFVLVWGEARVNIATTIERAPIVNDDNTITGAASYTGALSFARPAEEPLLDGEFAYVKRYVETCAWVEFTRKKRTGATVVYEKKWLVDVPDSTQFETRGYDNPQPMFSAEETVAAGLSVGEFGLSVVTDFLALDPMAPRKSQVFEARFVDQEWAYIGSDRQCHTDGGAAVGDQRIRFDVLRAGDLVTVFGKIHSDRIDPFRGQVLLARGGRNALLQHLKQQRTSEIWVYRAAGGVILWGAFYLILSPLLLMFAWIPVLGTLIRGAATVLTLISALATTLFFVFAGWGMSFFTGLFGGLVE